MYRTILTAIIVALTAFAVGCATGPEEAGAPEVQITLAGRGYISPEASPGLKDSFRSPLEVTPGTEDAVIQHFEMTVKDVGGDTVLTVSNSVDEEQELVPDPEALTVPRHVVWTGVDDDGDFVEEGIYTINVAVTDNVERTGTSNTVEVMVDNTPPMATVEVLADAFSPNDDGVEDTIEITQTVSGADMWTGEFVRISDDDNVVRKEAWSQDVPERVTWDGRTSRDRQASPGRYRYVLTGRDLAGNATTVETDRFLLDLNVASVDIEVSPKPFTPDGDGRRDNVTLNLSADDRTAIESWQLEIFDPRDELFYETSGEGEPEDTVTWDGRSEDGELVGSAEEYTAVLQVTDEVGNESSSEATIPVGILVTEDDAVEDGYRIRVSNIHFVPFEADYENLDDTELVEENMDVLDEIASVLKEFPDREIVIEGHAVHLTTGEEERETEQEETLLPLSQDRADVIKDALVERDVPEEMLSTRGRGGSEPIVDHSNEEERWKNRRVEFEIAARNY
ncbi:MAG: OmpA family protein [Spirochaetaceae bacterium]